MRIRKFNEGFDNDISKFKDITTHIAESLRDYTKELNYYFYWYNYEFESIALIDEDKLIEYSDIDDKYKNMVGSDEKSFLFMGIAIFFSIDLVDNAINNANNYLPFIDFIRQLDNIGSMSETLSSLRDQFDESSYKTTVYIDRTVGVISFNIEIIDIQKKFQI